MKKGWIKSIRKSKGLKFLGVTDGVKDFQITLHDGVPIIGEIKVGASFSCMGSDTLTPAGLPEFTATELTILGKSDDLYPIQPKEHSSDFLRTIPELRGRTKKFQATWRIRHHLTQAIHSYFDSKQFFQYYTPIITQSDCEGAGETFDITSDWLSEKLTVSGQLHGEVGMMALGKIYTFSPCFRAEKSTTRKHLSEFWMIEPEVAFTDLTEIMGLAIDMLWKVLSEIFTKCETDLKILRGDDLTSLFSILQDSWGIRSYDEIVEEFKVKWGDDISTEIEKKIIEKYKRPIFITKYPKELKPFYMLKDDKYAYCFDLIFPEIGELIGGSQREHDYDKLKISIQEAGLDEEKMQWYLRTRQWGSVPHSGFGLGFERLLLFITGQDKIHDVIPFPISY